MPIEKIRLGTNEDGTPHFLFRAVNDDGTPNPDAHLVYTGPNISGAVDLPDGSTVDVSELFTEAESPEHALAISDAVGRRFEDEGHPAHRRDGEETLPFLLTPSELSHEPDGAPSEAFAEAVEAHVPAGRDSSPQAIIARLAGKQG